MWKRWFLKLYINLVGIKFCCTEIDPTVIEFKRAIFTSVGDYLVEFSFYKKTSSDFFYRFGLLRKRNIIGYVIKAKIDNRFPMRIQRYHGVKIHFESDTLIIKDDQVIASVLLELYLDYLQNDLK